MFKKNDNMKKNLCEFMWHLVKKKNENVGEKNHGLIYMWLLYKKNKKYEGNKSMG